MVTNNNTQIRSRMERLARQKSTGVAIAVLLSIFTANLQAARGGYAGGSHGASGSAGNRTAPPSSRMGSSANHSSRPATGRTPQPKTPQPKTPQPKTPQPKTPQPKTPQPKRPRNGGDVVRYNHIHHISDVHFRTHFGREHSFRINRPVIVEGRPRFVFGGVAFGIVGPWPHSWYYSDAVYVENIDGDYFLCNTANPGVRIPINVVS